MSTENYKDFQFRYCWDVDFPNTIRIYVETRPQKVQHLNPEDIHLNPIQGGAPEHIRFPNDRRVSLFLEAQTVAHEWANRVLKVVDGNAVPSTTGEIRENNLSNERRSHGRFL